MAKAASRAPLIKLWIFCGLLLPLTIGLGVWQLERAAQKQVLLDAEQLKAELATVTMTETELLEGAALNNRAYRLEGHYHSQSLLLDNRQRDGRVGYEVLTAFYLSKHSFIVLNRGWVPAGKYREQLPDIPHIVESVAVTGSFYQPDGQVPILSGEKPKAAWPLRVQAVDWEEIDKLFAGHLLIRRQFRLGDSNQPGAFVAEWSLPAMSVDKHYGYAFQWFAMSLALLVLTLTTTIKLQQRRAK